LRCPARHERDALVIAPEGELDLESASDLRAVLDEHLGAGLPRLVLDLRGLTFIDSTGLRAVIEADRSAAARGVDLTVLPGPPQVQRIFEVTGTADIFPAG
jgi:anti-anti-sigma factor